MRDMIAYMNARKAAKAATGGAKQDLTAKYAPDRELDLWERTDQAIDTAWMDHRIAQDVMWQQIFERFGYLPDEQVPEIPF